MSNQNYYQNYINSVLQLAATIVIKSTDTADGLNQYITDMYGAAAVDTMDPTTWKYYLNVSGEYHPTDTMMTVVSMDTLQVIDFTKENLETNLATAAGYQYGTPAYNELVATYPTQELLILGILYPADIDTAIAAQDGTILAYPPNLIEVNEYSFLLNLQTFIYGYKQRWVNPQFTISDPLYPAVNHGIMYLMLVLEIINIRKAACKTNEAHSYHVQAYLASHQGLDQYLPQMTLSQSLWFYRNICYIERNIGQRQIFDLLLEHIMTERSLPLAEWLMEHDISSMPASLVPNITFVRVPLNGENDDSNNIIDLDEMLDKEANSARDNTLYQPDYEPTILTEFQNSRSATLMTKAVESDMIDFTNSSPYILPDILLNHWLWLASNGLYSAYVTTTNQQTGESISLSVQDAWTLMWYCYMTSNGIDLSEAVIPQMFAMRVQRIPMPTVTDLMSVVDPKYITPNQAQFVIQMNPVINPLVSTEAFYTLCTQICTAANSQLNYVALQEHKDRRAYMNGMIERMYSDNVVYTADVGQTYQSWFQQRNLNFSTMSNDQLNLTYLDLVKQATGVAQNPTTSVAALQTAMIKMFAQLSSYNIQFLSEINSSNIRNVNGPVIRVGDITASGSYQVYDPDSTVDVLDARMGGEALRTVNTDRLFSELFLFHGTKRERVEIRAKPRMGQHSVRWNVQGHIGLQVRLANPPGPNTEGVIPVVGIDAWLALPPQERYDFYDQYGNNDYYYFPPGDIPLSQVVTRTLLNGLTWLG
jgi:hypothetical protein